MRLCFNLSLAVLALLLQASFALGMQEQDQSANGAGAAGQQRTDVFTRMDANGDGVLTEADAVSEGRKVFLLQLRQAADANGDGRVSRQEYQAVQRLSLTDEPGKTEQSPVAAAFLFVLDVDRDGALSSAEIAIAAERLRMLDADNNGEVSAEELQAAGELAVESLANEDRAAREIAALFAEFDKNHDGQITLPEAPPNMQKAFDRLDVDANGNISLEEFSHALRRVSQSEDNQSDDNSRR